MKPYKKSTAALVAAIAVVAAAAFWTSDNRAEVPGLSRYHVQRVIQAQQATIAMYGDYPVPDEATLCGEKVPLNEPAVRELLDRELTISAWDHAQVLMWLKRAPRYFPAFEIALAERKMPDDLKYLAVAESALIPHIRSHMGATGAWQFMPATGRRYGLRHNRHFDDRLNVEKSTRAALDYLSELHGRFGSWALAMAAYNCGENRVEKAVDTQRMKDYYHLSLPLETERYIYRIIAIKTIMESPGTYGYHVPEDQTYEPPDYETVKVSLPRNLPIVDVAFALGTHYRGFKDMNPEFRTPGMPRGTYTINVPTGTAEKAPAIINNLVATAPRVEPDSSYYIVRRGDTLSGIAEQTGVSTNAIKRLNRIRGSRIMVGQRLRLE
ncbi:MAG: transglycosylase SLT domain-containing protein [Desulfatibacillaceae bacterium]